MAHNYKTSKRAQSTLGKAAQRLGWKPTYKAHVLTTDKDMADLKAAGLKYKRPTVQNDGINLARRENRSPYIGDKTGPSKIFNQRHAANSPNQKVAHELKKVTKLNQQTHQRANSYVGKVAQRMGYKPTYYAHPMSSSSDIARAQRTDPGVNLKKRISFGSHPELRDARNNRLAKAVDPVTKGRTPAENDAREAQDRFNAGSWRAKYVSTDNTVDKRAGLLLDNDALKRLPLYMKNP